MTIIVPGTGAMYAGDIGTGLACLIIYAVTWAVASQYPGGPLVLLPLIVLITSIALTERAVRAHNRAIADR
jgi:hypothetical protein